MKTNILFEDQHILVCHKPAGLAVQSGRVGEPDVLSELKKYRARKKEVPDIFPVHRLDQPVDGLIVCAKTKQAAASLSTQVTGDDKGMTKEYAAFVYVSEASPLRERLLTGEKIECRDYLLRDAKTNSSSVVPEGTKGAKPAHLTLQLSKMTDSQTAEVRVHLDTGRHHQIRVQCAAAGLPLLGDRKYGTEESNAYAAELGLRFVGLCACRLEFVHPGTHKKMTFALEELPWSGIMEKTTE